MVSCIIKIKLYINENTAKDFFLLIILFDRKKNTSNYITNICHIDVGILCMLLLLLSLLSQLPPKLQQQQQQQR